MSNYEKQLPLFDCPLPKIRRRRTREIPETTLSEEIKQLAARKEKRVKAASKVAAKA